MSNRSIVVIIDLPGALSKYASGGKQGKMEFKLHPKELDQSWLEFFKVKNDSFAKALVRRGGSTYTIMDKRNGDKKKVWNLSATISNYVDSFGRTLQKYNATIGTTLANTGPSSPQAKSSQPTPSTSKATAAGQNTNSKRVSFSAQHAPPHVSPKASATIPLQSSLKRKGNTTNANHKTPPKSAKVMEALDGEIKIGQSHDDSSPASNRFGFGSNGIFSIPGNHKLPIIIQGDDNASMAESTFSQDSQDDLRENGVNIEDIKDTVIQRVNRLDNNTMLRVRHELQGLVKNGKYFRAIKYIPSTANVLSYMFNLDLVGLN